MEDCTLKLAGFFLIVCAGLVLSCSGLLPRRHTAPGSRGEALLTSASAAFQRGDLGSAVSLAEETQREALALDDFSLRARALFALAGIRRWMGEGEAALMPSHEGLFWARKAGDPCLEAEGLLLRCGILYSLNDSMAIAMHSIEAAETACSSPVVQSGVALMKARFEARAGRLAEAQRLLGQSSDPFTSHGWQSQLRQERLFLRAYIRGREGSFEQAIETAQAVLHEDRQNGRRTAIVDDLWLLARLYREADDISAAKDAAQRAMGVLEAMHPLELTVIRRRQLEDWLEALVPEQ